MDALVKPLKRKKKHIPSIHDLKQSSFLTKADVTPPIIATISGYKQVNVAKEGAMPDEKFVLTFEELEKPLVLNSTNGQIIAAITGHEEFDGWIKTKIVLYHDPNVSYAGKLVGGIRVRAVRGAKPAASKPAPPPPPAAEEYDPDSDVPF